MKKTFIILALLVLIVSFVSAGSLFIDTGVSFSTGNRRTIIENTESDPASVTVVSLPFEIGYRESFGGDIIVSCSVAPYIPLSESIEGRSSNDKLFPLCTSIKVQTGYSMKVNKEMKAEFLGGFSFAMGSKSSDNTKSSFNTFSLVGEAGIKYKLDKSFFFRAGAKFGIPFATNQTTKTTIGSSSLTSKTKYSGFMINFTPFVGGAYQF